MFNIEENLKKLPDTPGVYMHKDKMGQIIYVGKAVSLRNRVRQYFRSQKNMDSKVRAMVSHIAEFEYITCATEMEALILECNLIKKYRPKYNILMRDDKTYPYIKLTMKEKYPRLLKTRIMASDGSRYFGPYSDAGAVNEIVDLLNSVYALKRCSDTTFVGGHRPCLNFHIMQCEGICTGNVTEEDYTKKIDAVAEFLNGKQGHIVNMLTKQMNEASDRLDFEEAALLRDKLIAAKALAETQRVVLLGAGDMDVILAVRGNEEHYAAVFFIRDGKLSGRETYGMQGTEGVENIELIAEFIKQYYSDIPMIPGEILVAKEPAEKALIEEYLREKAGHKVSIYVPQKGSKKDLLRMTQRDVTEMVKSIDERAKAGVERRTVIKSELDKLRELMGYEHISERQYRVEAYDISNTNGVDTVGGMVVFEGSRPMRKDYRRFKVRTVDGADDYGSLQEVLYRRLKRYEAGDTGFIKLPDFLFIDGGKGQVSAVSNVLNAMKIKLPVVGMAKDDFHRTRALIYCNPINGEFCEVELKERPMLFKYTGTIQEEVHRFAVEYHRNLRSKNTIGSLLDDIEGIGKIRRNALLAHFGSIDAIKKASMEELLAVPGITRTVSEKIKEYFDC